MSNLDQNVRKALAVSNLNMFLRDLAIRPEGTLAVARIPESIGTEQLVILRSSLAVIGFDVGPDRQNRTPNSDVQGEESSEIWVGGNDRDAPFRDCMAPKEDLCFSRAGINKLIEAGVSTPALLPLLPRQTAAKRVLE